MDAPTDNIRTFGQPHAPGRAIRNRRLLPLHSVIREIEIWRVAVPMIKRYAGDPEANGFQRAEQLVVKSSI